MALFRWPLLLLKYGLALLGGYLLVALYIERWGVAATLWFLGAPFIYAFLRALNALQTAGRTPSAPSIPAPR